MALGLRRAAARPGRRSCGRRRGSSKRATCNTGGTHRPDAEFAHASPTTCTSFHSSRAITFGVTGDAAILDEQVPFLRAPVLKPDQEEDYNLPEVSEQTANAVRTLRTGAGLRAETRASRPPVDGHRRLERRYE